MNLKCVEFKPQSKNRSSKKRSNSNNKKRPVLKPRMRIANSTFSRERTFNPVRLKYYNLFILFRTQGLNEIM